MPRNRGKPSRKRSKRDKPTDQPSKPSDSPRLWDYEKVGPVSIEGVEASDLPDKGRGSIETNPSKESARKLPKQTGEFIAGETGLRADPEIADADRRGGRKRN